MKNYIILPLLIIALPIIAMEQQSIQAPAPTPATLPSALGATSLTLNSSTGNTTPITTITPSTTPTTTTSPVITSLTTVTASGASTSTATKSQLIASIPTAPKSSCWTICFNDVEDVLQSPEMQAIEEGLMEQANSSPATSALAKLLQQINNNMITQNAKAQATTNQTIQTTALKNYAIAGGLGAINLAFILYAAFGK